MKVTAKSSQTIFQMYYKSIMVRYLKILFLLINFFSYLDLSGQSIVRSSLSSIGSTYSADGFILRQTIAQPSNTIVGSNSGFVLIQGFQQPLYSKVIPILNIPIDFTLSPNPAYEKTLLELKGEISSYSVTISNSNGMVMTRLNNQKLPENWLDITNLPAGIYFVTIISDSRSGSKKLIVNH
jgi:hypothetical protein